MGALLTAFTAVLIILGLRANGWLVSVSRRRLQQEALSAALHQRNALLHAVSTAATELTTATPSAAAIPDLLESVGAAIGADRILVFESGSALTGPPSLLHFWQRPESPVTLDATFFEADKTRSAFLSDPLLAALTRAPAGDGRDARARPRPRQGLSRARRRALGAVRAHRRRRRLMGMGRGRRLPDRAPVESGRDRRAAHTRRHHRRLGRASALCRPAPRRQ